MLHVTASCKAAGHIVTRSSSRQQYVDIKGKPGRDVDVRREASKTPHRVQEDKGSLLPCA